ncbi:MAG: hypothetical protein IKP98_02340 [Bacilli bacterium]|nr:hypothetical protein [Bacilli bacterium]
MGNDIFDQNLEEKIEEKINLKSIKDITLANGERMLIMYEGNSYEPIVIHINYDMKLLDEIAERMRDNPNYQSGDPTENTRAILAEIAKEQNSYETVVPLDRDHIVTALSTITDEEKLARLRELISKAYKKNEELPEYEKFTYIDITQEFIISNSGKVLEAKVNEQGDLVVQSPEEAAEYKDEDVDPGSMEGETLVTSLAPDSTGLNSEDYTEDEIEDVYEEVFSKGGVPDNLKADIIKKLKDIASNPELLENSTVIPTAQKDWFYSAYGRLEEIKSKRAVKTMTLENKEAGISSYVYIALVVLVIVFAIFMFIIFRR